MQYQTQKARGVSMLASLRNHGVLPGFLQTVDFCVLPYNLQPLHQLTGLFARPCPERPRHGFVESRKVNNLQELLDTYVQAKAADPKAEVLVMPALTGLASAVVADHAVTWGKGNDGVTGGKGVQFVVPIQAGKLGPRLKDRIKSCFGHDAGITDSPFLELVEHKGDVTIVQMRDGPSMGVVRYNFVPKNGYRVQSIVHPTVEELDNLLAWEARVHELEHGTAIVCAGMSLASHVAVHGIAKGLAVVTEPALCKNIKVEDILYPEAEQPPKLTKRHYNMMRGYFRRHVTLHRKSATQASVAILHTIPYWGPEPHLLKLRVAGVVMLARLLTAACLGEARHFYRSGPGSFLHGIMPCVEWEALTGVPLSKAKGDLQRESVFMEALAINSLPLLLRYITQCVEDFRGPWRGASDATDAKGDYTGSCSFGGPKWRDAARLTREMISACIAFCDAPGQGEWDEVLDTYNRAVNAVHNGGSLLSKFCSPTEIDNMVATPAFGLCTPQVMDILCGPIHKNLGEQQRAKARKIEKRVAEGFNIEAVLAAEKEKVVIGLKAAAAKNGFYPCPKCTDALGSSIPMFHKANTVCGTSGKAISEMTINALHGYEWVGVFPPSGPTAYYKCAICPKMDGYSMWHPVEKACADHDHSIKQNSMLAAELTEKFGTGGWTAPLGPTHLATKAGKVPCKEDTFKSGPPPAPVMPSSHNVSWCDTCSCYHSLDGASYPTMTDALAAAGSYGAHTHNITDPNVPMMSVLSADGKSMVSVPKHPFHSSQIPDLLPPTYSVHGKVKKLKLDYSQGAFIESNPEPSLEDFYAEMVKQKGGEDDSL